MGKFGRGIGRAALGTGIYLGASMYGDKIVSAGKSLLNSDFGKRATAGVTNAYNAGKNAIGNIEVPKPIENALNAGKSVIGDIELPAGVTGALDKMKGYAGDFKKVKEDIENPDVLTSVTDKMNKGGDISASDFGINIPGL